MNARPRTALLTCILLSSTHALPAALQGAQGGRVTQEVGAESAHAPRLTAADAFELEYADAPRFSPDGAWIAFERHSFDALEDVGRSRVWLVRRDGGALRALGGSGGAQHAPRWSPGGDSIAVLEGGERGLELHVHWLESGRDAAVTDWVDEAAAPSAPVWSPDGRWIAFTALVEETPAALFELPAAPPGAHWAEAPVVITKLHYRQDGEGHLKQGQRRLFVVPAEGGTPRALSGDAFGMAGDVQGDPCWTPDGRELVFACNARADAEHDPLDTELWAVPVAGGAARALTDRRGPDRDPCVSPDGSRVAYVGFDDRAQGYQVTRLYVASLEEGSTRPVLELTRELDRDVAQPRWSRDGARILFTFEDRGSTKVGAVDLSGRVETLAAGLGGASLGRPYSGGTFDEGSGELVVTRATPQRPPDLVRVRAGQEALALTHLNDDLLGARELASLEELEWTSSADGRAIQGWVLRPPRFDAGKTYPLILEIHGGPFACYGPRFAIEHQLYAAADYVVLYGNPRGSTSYGEAFGNLIHHAYPGHDYDDLMSGVDALIARGSIDPERLYVTGGSGGGVLTAWIVGSTDRFRAAVVAKPVIDWASFVLTADETAFFTKYWFPALPWQDPQHYFARSPLARVGNVRTPTLVLSGESDLRTPISQAEQFYAALKLRGVETALVRVPGASHGLTARPSRVAVQTAATLGWFDRHAP